MGNMKVVLSGDSKPYREEISKADLSTKKFAGDAGSAMNDLAGVFGVNIGDISSSITSMSKSFKLLHTSMAASAVGASTFRAAMNVVKIAAISTGIGALIVALGSLVAYFTQTERGAEFVERAMAGLKAAFKVITDHAAKFGEGLFLIFSGKFKDGAKALGESFSGIGSEMVREAGAASDLTRRLQALEDAEKQLGLVNSERRANARELFAQSKEEGVKAENKVKLIKQAMALEALAYNEEKDQAIERRAIHAEQVALGEARDEQNYKTLELQGAINNLTRDAANTEISYGKALKAATEALNKDNEALKEKGEIQARALLMGEKPQEMQTKTTKVTTKYTSEMAGLGDNSYFLQAETVKAKNQEIADSTIDLSGAVQGAFGEMGASLGMFLGDLMTGKGEIKDFGSAIAGAFADLAITVGKQMIAFGIAGTVLKVLEKKPALAIAAGVALIALGKAAKNSIASSLSGGGGATSAASGGGGGDYNYDSRQSMAASKMQTINLVVGGEFKLQNGVLVAGINQENQRKAIVT